MRNQSALGHSANFRDPRTKWVSLWKTQPWLSGAKWKSPGILGQVCTKGKTCPVNRNIKQPGPGTSGKHIRKRPSLWVAWEGAQSLWGLCGHRKTYSVNSRSHNSSHKEDGIPSPHSNPSSPQREDKSHPHEGPPEALGTMSKPHDTLPQQAIVMFTQACVLWGAWLARKQRSLRELADGKGNSQLHNF